MKKMSGLVTLGRRIVLIAAIAYVISTVHGATYIESFDPSFKAEIKAALPDFPYAPLGQCYAGVTVMEHKLNRAGIKTEIATGDSGLVGHMWIMAKKNGRVLAIDSFYGIMEDGANGYYYSPKKVYATQRDYDNATIKPFSPKLLSVR